MQAAEERLFIFAAKKRRVWVDGKSMFDVGLVRKSLCNNVSRSKRKEEVKVNTFLPFSEGLNGIRMMFRIRERRKGCLSVCVSVTATLKIF
jgi:hypothetical protein